VSKLDELDGVWWPVEKGHWAFPLKYEMDKRVYHFGANFVGNSDRGFLKWGRLFRIGKWLLETISKSLVGKRRPSGQRSSEILVDAYFGLEGQLAAAGLNAVRAPWGTQAVDLSGHLSLVFSVFWFKCLFAVAPYRKFLASSTRLQMDSLRRRLLSWMEGQKLQAVLLSNEVAFFEVMAIECADLLGIPVFESLHGLPAYYDKECRPRISNILVWGPQIKKHLVDGGLASERIAVVGHPRYENLASIPLRFGFDSILLITKMAPSAPVGVDTKFVAVGRDMALRYLAAIRDVLEQLGIKHVRVRPHPGERADWYEEFLDPGFFTLDRLDLPSSLRASTLVIGPTSTVFLEALIFGVNYIVYEPRRGGHGDSYFGAPLGPPFDQSDSRVPVANNCGELRALLENGKSVGSGVIEDYIASFSTDRLIQALNRGSERMSASQSKVSVGNKAGIKHEVGMRSTPLTIQDQL